MEMDYLAGLRVRFSLDVVGAFACYVTFLFKFYNLAVEGVGPPLEDDRDFLSFRECHRYTIYIHGIAACNLQARANVERFRAHCG